MQAFQRAYAKDLILPTAQEFADFQEEMRMQRRLRNLEDENDPAGSKQCAYFSGRRNNEAGYIEDTIIKDSDGCLKELPYTCVLYLPDKGSYRPILTFRAQMLAFRTPFVLLVSSENRYYDLM